MTEDDRERHHRRSVRLKDYDYAQPGAYFVTVCTQERACLFGHVVNGEMRLNDAGEIVREEWFNTAAIRPYVRLNGDECVVMPNHMHAIVWIVDNDADISNGRGVWPYAQNGVAGIANDDAIITNVAGVSPYATQDIARIVGDDVGATGRSPETSCTSSPDGRSPASSPNGPKHGSIGAIMAGFKSVTAKRINQMRDMPGTKVWQRNYHEHVIRDEAALDAIRQYIMGNTARWAEDPENPAGIVDGERVRAIGRLPTTHMATDVGAIGRSPLQDNMDVNGGMA
jgi:putative transposase